MKKFTKNSDDRALGAAAVSVVFGAVGAGMGAVMWGLTITQTGGTFVALALIIFLVIMLGWRDNTLPPPGSRKAPSSGDHNMSGSGSASGASPSPSSGSTAGTSAPSSGTAPAASAPGVAAASAPFPGAAPSDPAAASPAAGRAATAPADPTPSGTDAGTRPKALDGPRDGEADDLKQIKGVGPALEKLCHQLGFYHFDQIASWTEAEVAWVDQNLEGFKGRVTRDSWVEQARVLASGGNTDFSQKVEKGDVY